MILQARDVEILKFIAKFGFVNSLQITNLFKLSKPRTSQLLMRLSKNDYLSKEQLLAKQPSIYTLKTKSADLLKVIKFDILPHLKEGDS